MDLDSVRILLDARAVLPLFAKVPALANRSLRDVEFNSLWVKPGRHFNVSYTIHPADPSQPALLGAGFVLPANRAAEVAAQYRTHEQSSGSACPHCNTMLALPTLVLQLFPFDYRLPTLPACLDVQAVSLAMAPKVITGCSPAGYRPGVRCQIRYQCHASEVFYGKVAVERSAGDLAAVTGRVAAAVAARGQSLSVTRPVRYVPGLALTMIEAAMGVSLFDVLRDNRDGRLAMRSTAGALRELHRLDVDDIERTHETANEIELVRPWVDLVATLYPSLAPALSAGLAALRNDEPTAEPARALVHRDFYDKQILIDTARVNILDMDTVCRGDPEIDVANFAAHLRLRGLQWHRASQFRALEEEFLNAYSAPLQSRHIDWYRRSALLRLACGYALRPHWRSLAPALAREATP